VTFWTLITAIIILFTLSALLPDFKLPGLLSGISGKTNIEKVAAQTPEKEKVYIAQTQYLEIEKKIEWFYFVATGYSGDDAAQGTGQKTSTGKNVFEGIIAVDPKIIPYGTKIEIKDTGYFIAEDCGSKIKGNRIDIYFDLKADAKEFGKQGVWVRFVDDNSVEIAQITNNSMKSIK
jgi:3D (Asp-Asp-Asp) domain-containing protein